MKMTLVIALLLLASSARADPAAYADIDAAVRASLAARHCKTAKPIKDNSDAAFEPCAVLQAFLGAKTPALKTLAGAAYVGRSLEGIDGTDRFEYSTLVIAPFAPPPADTGEPKAIDEGIPPSVPASARSSFEAHLRTLKPDNDGEKATIRAYVDAVRAGKPVPKSSLTTYLDGQVARHESRQLARTDGESVVHFHGSTAIFLRQAGNRLLYVEVDASPTRKLPLSKLYAGEIFVPRRP